MKDMWNTLEKRTRAWNALERQGLAGAIWADYVLVRFGRTGDPRALEYLYPYLNHADKRTRLQAIEVADRVFEGRGPRVIDGLNYFTKNPDPFLRDRAVQVVGTAVSGSQDAVVLEVLAPYLNHRNQFIRELALVALGKASAGQASPRILGEIQRVARTSGPREDEVDLAMATTFAGHPTEEVYTLVSKPALPEYGYGGNERAVSVLVRGASDAWYERACREVFEPRLHADDKAGWRKQFIYRDGIAALCHAAPGRGMEPLRRMLHLRNNRCTGHAMMSFAQECFAGADPAVHLAPLTELARNGDVQAQRIAAVCLGRMMMGAEDGETIDLLRELCDAKNNAVQSAALIGLGIAARSTCDEALRQLCLEHALVDETARSSLPLLLRGTESARDCQEARYFPAIRQ